MQLTHPKPITQLVFPPTTPGKKENGIVNIISMGSSFSLTEEVKTWGTQTFIIYIELDRRNMDCWVRELRNKPIATVITCCDWACGQGIWAWCIINYQHLGCSTDQESLLVYDGEAREGRSEATSMRDLATGRCCGCHKLLGWQTSFQTCPKIPDIAVNWKKRSNLLISLQGASCYVRHKYPERKILQTRSSDESASSPTTAFIAWTSFPMA